MFVKYFAHKKNLVTANCSSIIIIIMIVSHRKTANKKEMRFFVYFQIFGQISK